MERIPGVAYAKKSTSKRQGPRGSNSNSQRQPLAQAQQAEDNVDLEQRENNEIEEEWIYPYNDLDEDSEFKPGVRRSRRKKRDRIVSESSIDDLVIHKKRNVTKKNTNKRKRRVDSSSSEGSSREYNLKIETDHSEQSTRKKHGDYCYDDVIVISDSDPDYETENFIDLLKEIPPDSSDSPSPSTLPSNKNSYEDELLNYHDDSVEKEEVIGVSTETALSKDKIPLKLSVLLNPIDMSSCLWEIEDTLIYTNAAYPQQKERTKSKDFNAGKNIGLDSKWRLILKRTINKENKELDVFTLSIALIEINAKEDYHNQKKICAKISTSFINEKGQFYRADEYPIEILKDKNAESENFSFKEMTTAIWKKENIYEIDAPQEIIPSFKIKDKYLFHDNPLKLNIYFMVYIYGGYIPQCK